ncbi:putative metalloprotease CJM1_0395 family protein [Nitrospira sp. M1]
MEISPTTISYNSPAHFFEPKTNVNSRKAGASSPENEGEQQEIAKLRARDKEVRAHEHAHSAAAGGLAKGGASFTYERGPDGRQYAVGGEVNIDTSPIAGDPEATIRKAQQIRAAALAPADPSSQDRAVAASTSALEAQARQELAKEQEDDTKEQSKNPASLNQPQIDLFV